MPQAPDRFQPANPNPARPGFADSPNSFWKALEGVVNGLRGFQGAKANPSLFHEPTMTAASSVGPAMQGGLDVMADPRNAWMGMGPVTGMALMGRGIRGATKGMQDLGGFNVPVGEMRRAMDMPRPNTRIGASGDELDVRKAYMGTVDGSNMLAGRLMDLNHPQYQQLAERYQMATPDEKELLNKTMAGLESLRQEKVDKYSSIPGGWVPPKWLNYGQ